MKVLFFLFACDDKRHLNLLAKIAHLTANKTLIDKIKTGLDKSTLLNWIRDWEQTLSQKTAIKMG
ncbi:MAG: hypothetical protein FJZ60_05030 [Chlamydiae bacterium]|nr:hypothetical protein [Chlamydiota bacterium]